MASVCISNCINDARAPVRPTYINLYKWPESDAEFIRSVSSKLTNRTSRVVDSISCRQMYLRSYTFSREEDHVPERTNNCFAKVGMRRRQNLSRRKKKKTKAAAAEEGSVGSCGGTEKIARKCSTLKKAKELSCAVLTSVFRRLLSCTAKVDVADNLREVH